jgi:hypothetical protein
MSYIDLHRIRDHENAESKWTDMLNNPVRAGLTSDPGLWPYQGQVFEGGFWY